MTLTRNWTLRRRVTVLCVAVSAVLVALGLAATMAAASSSRHLDTILVKTGPMRAAGETLNTALVNQDSGVRGYAVTGNLADLRPYEQGVAEEQALLRQIEALLGPTDDDVRAQLEVVRAQAVAWRSEIADPVIATVRAESPQAAQALITEQSRQRFEALRASVTTLQEEILELREKSADAARDSSNTLVMLLISAAAVIVLAGVALLLLLDRMVARPVTQLAEQVREVATGAYDRRISVTGSAELAQLGRDIDAMRQKIAAELTEVRLARGQLEDAHQQLAAQADELTRSNRDLEQFAYVASHDLQEPLRKVASFCQLLQRRYAGQLDERADQYIGFAVDGAQRMQRLINDLLAFSRIGRLTAGFTDVDLNSVMGEVSTQLEAVQQAAGGEITWAELPVVHGEEPLLTTLLTNLASNALKFRKPDQPPEVHISARRDGDLWEITCRDNGIGIEQEFADKIFVIFQRLHSKDAYPGTGIGLAIAKKIVEYHGGHIWLDPEYRDGAAISFTLPVSSAAGPAAAAEDAGPAGSVGAQPPAGSVETRSSAEPARAQSVQETVG